MHPLDRGLLDRQIAALDKEIVRRSREDEVARRLMTIPGIGPITATAITALAPPPGTFAKGRDFAAWVGLTPRPNDHNLAYLETKRDRMGHQLDGLEDRERSGQLDDVTDGALS